MKKLLITTIILMGSGHIMAEGKIGGRISSTVEYERDGNGKDSTTLSDNESRLWIMGSEDLGGDLKLIYGLNSFVAFDYNGWATDDSYVGLRGKFGTFKLGRLSTPLHYLTSEQDAFPGNSYAKTFGRFTRFGGREIAMAYESVPKNGFNYRIQLAPGYNKYQDPDRDSDWQAGLGLHYRHPDNGFNAHYALEYAKDGSPDAKKDRHVHSLKIGYDKDKLSLAAGFQYAGKVPDRFHWEDPDEDVTDTKDYQITAGYKFGVFQPQIGIAYGRSGSGKNYRQLAISNRYDFSKRTKVELGAGVVKESRDPKKSWALGMTLTHSLQ
ncbi:MAG: porin [Neisseria sp.]|nr:porin [Neisseria sp.]